MPFPLLRQESAGERIAEVYCLVTKARVACSPVLWVYRRESMSMMQILSVLSAIQWILSLLNQDLQIIPRPKCQVDQPQGLQQNTLSLPERVLKPKRVMEADPHLVDDQTYRS